MDGGSKSAAARPERSLHEPRTMNPGRPDAAIPWSAAAMSARPQLVSAARRVVRDRAEAEDVADEAIARLAGAISAGERIDSVMAWLHRAALRIAVDRARAWVRRRREPWQREASRRRAPPDPATALESTELRERLWHAILELPERQRDALVLRQMEGVGYDEVASRLGVTVSTARGHVHAARAALRRLLWEPERAPPDERSMADGPPADRTGSGTTNDGEEDTA